MIALVVVAGNASRCRRSLVVDNDGVGGLGDRERSCGGPAEQDRQATGERAGAVLRGAAAALGHESGQSQPVPQYFTGHMRPKLASATNRHLRRMTHDTPRDGGQPAAYTHGS